MLREGKFGYSRCLLRLAWTDREGSGRSLKIGDHGHGLDASEANKAWATRDTGVEAAGRLELEGVLDVDVDRVGDLDALLSLEVGRVVEKEPGRVEPGGGVDNLPRVDEARARLDSGRPNVRGRRVGMVDSRPRHGVAAGREPPVEVVGDAAAAYVAAAVGVEEQGGDTGDVRAGHGRAAVGPPSVVQGETHDLGTGSGDVGLGVEVVETAPCGEVHGNGSRVLDADSQEFVVVLVERRGDDTARSYGFDDGLADSSLHEGHGIRDTGSREVGPAAVVDEQDGERVVGPECEHQALDLTAALADYDNLASQVGGTSWDVIRRAALVLGVKVRKERDDGSVDVIPSTEPLDGLLCRLRLAVLLDREVEGTAGDPGAGGGSTNSYDALAGGTAVGVEGAHVAVVAGSDGDDDTAVNDARGNGGPGSVRPTATVSTSDAGSDHVGLQGGR